MDWYLNPPSAATATRLRRQITALLSRHTADKDQVWVAATTVGELVGNAVDHAGGPVWVSLDWSGRQPVLTVHDLGPTFELEPRLPEITAERGRGLWLVSQMVNDLAVAAKRAGGKRVTATLPVTRAEEPSYDPPPREINPLPTMEDAGQDGFGKESFLRALVVELALAVEETHGPQAAQAAVARVGSSIGSQMEREYRRANAVVERLSPEQVADCYVRLKAAIGGGFYPIEVSEERIVLGNTACPFGSVIRAQPALCRMTSSVFGGIAARNAGEAVVVLEERIAFGDPECRVTVLLGAQAASSRTGHRYGEPAHGSNGAAPDCPTGGNGAAPGSRRPSHQ
jgi:anti-sigma regulatory factor (Ser/Thr protein kinase)/predicted ArsR family transcriptional regulator